MNKRSRLILSISIITLTAAAFTYYLAKHGSLLRQIVHTPPLIIAIVFGLYVAILGALVLNLYVSLRMCRITLGSRDNILLNAYSLFANFFIPGQAGPGVRAAYLKKFRGLAIRKYGFAVLLYYGCYALVSGLLVLVGSHVAWWLTFLILLAVGGIGWLVIRWYSRRQKFNTHSLNLSAANLGYLLLATILQAVIQLAIYSVELHSLHVDASLKQAAAYTGIANFALFVSITPGAIGIRESFLAFSQRLYHISGSTIVAANVIDRSVYFVFLGVLFVFILAFRAQKKFAVKQPTTPGQPKVLKKLSPQPSSKPLP